MHKEITEKTDMKEIRWSEEKNEWLKKVRGIGFEDIFTAINENGILTSIKHPNPEKYPNQRVLIIQIGSYAYAIPYVKSKTGIFLKTIIPSRKYTKKYLHS